MMQRVGGIITNMGLFRSDLGWFYFAVGFVLQKQHLNSEMTAEDPLKTEKLDVLKDLLQETYSSFL